MKPNRLSGDMPRKNPLSFQLDLAKFEAASSDEKAQQIKERESVTFFKDGMRRFVKNKVALVSGIILIFIVLTAVFVPMFYPYTYDQQIGNLGKEGRDKSAINLAPFEYSDTEKERMENGEYVFPHILGTDKNSCDYFIRVVYGARISLVVGFFASIVVLIIGVLYGSISGYFGGKVDLVMMRIVDIIYSLPDLLMVILFSVLLKEYIDPMIKGTFLEKLGTGMISIFIVFALLYWVSMARLIRGQILTIKQQEYILTAKALGAKPSRIIRKHLLPNCISVIVISTALQIPNAIFTESYLSYLGLGVSIPMPSLGSLASEMKSCVWNPEQVYLFLVPALVICLIVLSLNLVGDGLRDAFDPKQKK